MTSSSPTATTIIWAYAITTDMAILSGLLFGSGSNSTAMYCSNSYYDVNSHRCVELVSLIASRY